MEEEMELSEEQLELVFGGNTREEAAEFASKKHLDEILNNKTIEELRQLKEELEGTYYPNQSVDDKPKIPR